jgi:hypothetical protein
VNAINHIEAVTLAFGLVRAFIPEPFEVEAVLGAVLATV